MYRYSDCCSNSSRGCPTKSQPLGDHRLLSISVCTIIQCFSGQEWTYPFLFISPPLLSLPVSLCTLVWSGAVLLIMPSDSCGYLPSGRPRPTDQLNKKQNVEMPFLCCCCSALCSGLVRSTTASSSSSAPLSRRVAIKSK